MISWCCPAFCGIVRDPWSAKQIYLYYSFTSVCLSVRQCRCVWLAASPWRHRARGVAVEVGRGRSQFLVPVVTLTWKTVTKGKGQDYGRYITALLPQLPAARRGETHTHTGYRIVDRIIWDLHKIWRVLFLCCLLLKSQLCVAHVHTTVMITCGFVGQTACNENKVRSQWLFILKGFLPFPGHSRIPRHLIPLAPDAGT